MDTLAAHRSPGNARRAFGTAANHHLMGPNATANGTNVPPLRNASNLRPISGEQHSHRRSSEVGNNLTQGTNNMMNSNGVQPNTGTYLPPIKNNSHMASLNSSGGNSQFHHSYLSHKNSFPNYYQPPQNAVTMNGNSNTAVSNHSLIDNQSQVSGHSYPVVQPLYGSQDHSFWQSKKDLTSVGGIPPPSQPVAATKSDYSTTSLPRSRDRDSSNRALERRPSNQSTASSRNFPAGKDTRASPGGALTVDSAMKQYMHKLTDFEHREIYVYNKIYFCGPNAKKRPGIIGGNQNCGYDDENGCYIPVPHDHVAYRYEVLKVIGKGSFGQVLKCYDHKTQTHIALKMVRNEKRFHRQAQEEIRILEHLRRQDVNNNHNIVHVLESFEFRNHQCITFELLSMNLYELIKKNKFHGFTLQLVRKFAHSLLQCLECLHRNKIIHCDLKPENILLKQQGRSGIKVIDFGSSCYEHQRIYTYIQSRFYRAPEVILGELCEISVLLKSFLLTIFHACNEGLLKIDFL